MSTFNGKVTSWHQPVKTQAGNTHHLIAAGEGIGLLFAKPFGKAIGVFGVSGMHLVERKIVVARLAGKFATDGIDAGGKAEAVDA